MFFTLIPNAINLTKGVDQFLIVHSSEVTIGEQLDVLDESLTRNGFTFAQFAKLINKVGDEIVGAKIAVAFELHLLGNLQSVLLPHQATFEQPIEDVGLNGRLRQFLFEFRITVRVGEGGREANDEQPPFQAFIIRVGKVRQLIARKNELVRRAFDGARFVVQ